MRSMAQMIQLALQYHQAGDLPQAESIYRQILQIDPRQVDALHMLGVLAHQTGKNDVAVDYITQALRLRPEFPIAYNNLGTALMAQGKLADALASFQQAVRLKPDLAQAHYNLGNALKDQGKLDEAIASYQQALRLRPDDADEYNNLGNALRERGKLDEAIAVYRAGLARKADGAQRHSNLIFSLIFHLDYDAAAILAECRRWQQQHAEPLAKFIQPYGNRPDPNRRLRIGYVSPDFRDHVLSFLTKPLLSNHDHRQVEIFCYSDVVHPDAVTMALRPYADVWRSTVGLTDSQVAELIRGDQIDILVDLTMHMADNRLLVFARKPAPVQVAWLAYPGTTGLATMDYRLTDPFLDPPGEHDSWYSEQSIRLPDTFWCYDPRTDQSLVNDLPALANGFITFGCLNNFWKVNDAVLMLWARALRAVPRSRLLLLAPRGQARNYVLTILSQVGIDEMRVEFTDRQPRPQYLQLYNRIDLGLDLLPYNGHTTSLDAFWMGVPTITLIGKTVVGRAGWSQLCNLGLRELAARTPEEFVEIAANLAGDLSRLQDLRQTLRPRMVRSPLMDAALFARNMERAFWQMWHSWCQATPAPACVRRSRGG